MKAKELLVKLLEKIGLRCSKCSAWGTIKSVVTDELRWGVNIGNVLFSDPFYMRVTTHRCSKCNQMISEKRELSNKRVE